ncbi:hypothetical protein J6590_004701 [Homalodisca vitripennis]|nr:hypothetical protein J6590_004701 [Homalodisca vitripennis]
MKSAEPCSRSVITAVVQVNNLGETLLGTAESSDGNGSVIIANAISFMTENRQGNIMSVFHK